VFEREVEAVLTRRDVVMEPARRILYDSPMRCTIAPEDLLQRGAVWTVIDYSTLERTDYGGTAQWTFDSPSDVRGYALWFETEFANGGRFSTSPGSGLVAYSQMFLPLDHTVHVPGGCALELELGARLVHDSYVWSWRTSVRGRDLQPVHDTAAQNSLAEVVIDPHAVPVTSMDVPTSLGPRGRALQTVLDGVREHHRGSDIARRLQAEDPSEFETLETAQAFVARWLAQLPKLESGCE